MIISLKTRHSKVYGDYQRLSVVIDTLHKKQRKEFLEKELQQLEKDIKTLVDHEHIFIEN